MSQYWQDFLNAQGYFNLQAQTLNALSHQNCLTALTSLGLLSIAGSDAKKFLQGQVTCNLDDVTLNQSKLGAYCNLKGRMQSLFRIYRQNNETQESYYLALPQTMLGQTQLVFKKYALFSKVTIEIEQHQVGLGFFGENITTALQESFPEIASLQQPYDYVIKGASKGNVSITRLPSHYPRYEIWGSPTDMAELWTKHAANCHRVLPQAWELLDIQSGVPTIYPQTSEEVLPHHANLSILNGISYTKGCYLGQEIIARMQYRGKIKKHLYRAFIQGTQDIPEPGTLVYCKADAPAEPGLVLRAAENASENIELLIVLDDQFNNFENVFLYSADGPKIHRLDLSYTW
ncbi:MAG: folate-binding protein YgfZ [Proteobacteria bacterium]|nr:folate-binding protein YgfZ [Pseudomonadota bacterium]